MVFDDVHKFLNELEEFKGNFLFRGMTKVREAFTKPCFTLMPGAFREKEIKKYSTLFPHSEIDTQKWILKVVDDIKKHPSTELASVHPFDIERICQLLIKNLQYNYVLYERYHSQKFPIDHTDEKLLSIFECGHNGHWAKEKTFQNYFHQFYLSLVPLCSLDGKVVKQSFVFEDITGVDETYPQHYGMQTAALDWTYDPYIALFFTIYTDKSYCDSEYLSISVYEEIIKEDSPVIIKDKNSFKNNPRATAQKGTFMCFRKPCSFYLQENRFPAVEDYDWNFKNSHAPKFFDLKKLVLMRSKKNIDFIKNILNEREINESSLLLPLHN